MLVHRGARQREPVAQGRPAARRLHARDARPAARRASDPDAGPRADGARHRRSDRRGGRGARPGGRTLVRQRHRWRGHARFAAAPRPDWLKPARAHTSCDAFEHFPPDAAETGAAAAEAAGCARRRHAADAVARCAAPADRLRARRQRADRPRRDRQLCAAVDRAARDPRGRLPPVRRHRAAPHADGGGAAASVRPSGAGRLVARGPLLPARRRRAAGGDDPGRAAEWIDGARTFSMEDQTRAPRGAIRGVRARAAEGVA